MRMGIGVFLRGISWAYALSGLVRGGGKKRRRNETALDKDEFGRSRLPMGIVVVVVLVLVTRHSDPTFRVCL